MPVNPNLVDEEYFGLSYAIMDLGKKDKEGNLHIEYWCSPSYSNDQSHDEKFEKLSEEPPKFDFKEYLLYT